MLTRREVEVELRSLFEGRDNQERRKREIARTRARARKVRRIATLVVLGLGLVGGLGMASLQSNPRGPTVIRQWARWGVEHVRPSESQGSGQQGLLFPSGEKRPRGSWYKARQEFAQEQGRSARRATDSAK